MAPHPAGTATANVVRAILGAQGLLLAEGQEPRPPGQPRARQAGNGKLPRAAKAPGGPACPTCGSSLPTAVAVLARELEAEGLGEAKALRAAAISWGLLRVP